MQVGFRESRDHSCLQAFARSSCTDPSQERAAERAGAIKTSVVTDFLLALGRSANEAPEGAKRRCTATHEVSWDLGLSHISRDLEKRVGMGPI